ncbi:MAG: phenylalanine--tRNA ligase subunit beta [Oligoflexia bacterium]|nr:phenylalanine--tRNA ligase subunit beta [Oligoflexia bacterium]
MKISLNLISKLGLDLKEYKAEPQKLADMLTSAGLEVEEVKDLSRQFQNVVVGKILEKNKHPNADQLTLCLVDTGDQKRKIVCGAKNHNANDLVVVALPGAVLPGNFEIKVSKIRGEESSGMLCSEKELGLSALSEGIMILPKDAPIGTAFSKYAKLDDVIFDIKVTPNRADCLSHYGLAREISAITGKTFEIPHTTYQESKESTKKIIKLVVEDTERSPRYVGRLIKNIKIKSSPDWLKQALEVLGLRPINNVVDATNYIMMMYGQPMHAFDLAKIKSNQIVVRGAKSGESFKSLDDKNLKLTGTELVIADGSEVLALAGVMGGLNSGVSEQTVDIFLEAAVFNAASVRRTAKLHSMETDSSYRFSRGVDPEGVILAVNKCCQLISEIAEGKVSSDFYDNYPRPINKQRIEFDLKYISLRLGFNLDSTECKKIFERLGCHVAGSGDKLLITPPAYRYDLRLAEDMGEEILRIKGFSHVPETLPSMSIQPSLDDKNYNLENKLSHFFASQGYAQAVNLSFLNHEYQKNILSDEANLDSTNIGFDLTKEAVKIKNPLNVDLSVMRKAVFVSLLKNMSHNVRHGILKGKLFELSPIFYINPTEDIRETRPFYEETHLGLIQWGESNQNWMKIKSPPNFFELKGVLENYFKAWNYKTYNFKNFKNTPLFLHPGQSAQISVEGKVVGFIGMLHPMVMEFLDLKINDCVICELNLKTLFMSQPRLTKSKDVAKFPFVERDVALLAPLDLPAGDIKQELLKAAGNLVVDCEIFDLFMGGSLPKDKRSIAFRLKYQDPLKTLSDQEVNALHQGAVKQVCDKLHLSVR